MTQILEQPPTHDQAFQTPPSGGPSNGWLVADYLRRIHWWVRLFGVCAIISVAGWVFLMVFLASAALFSRS